jgi:hypothetical protein
MLNSTDIEFTLIAFAKDEQFPPNTAIKNQDCS